MTKEEQREEIVSSAIEIGDLSLEDAQEFDEIVCNILGLDFEEIPPDFIFSILS